MLQAFARILLLLVAAGVVGCTSTRTSNTARTAKEQMLLSNAIDQSLDKVDFTPLGGQKVFVNDQYLDCVDKGYIVASLRHRLMIAGAQLSAAADTADVVMEIRSGGVGTDSSDAFIGIPEVTLPGMLTLPEIRLAERNSQYGYAKLGLILWDTKTGESLGAGGVSLAQADDNNWHFLGVGPVQTGSLKSDVALATSPARGMTHRRLPTQVAFAAPQSSPEVPPETDFQFASERTETTSP